jgi:hypothetical protein
MDLIVKNQEAPVKEDVSLEAKPEYVPKKIRLPKVELSEGIKAFDQRVKERKLKVYTENPFSYNSISLNKEKAEIPTQSAEQMISDPVYNSVAKFLGVDTIHDWNKTYDKVYAIVEWAKKEANLSEPEQIMMWIAEKVRTIPSVGNKNIDNLHIFAKLYLKK